MFRIDHCSKIQCAALCGTNPTCSAFLWSNASCYLTSASLLGGPDLDPVEAYADASFNSCTNSELCFKFFVMGGGMLELAFVLLTLQPGLLTLTLPVIFSSVVLKGTKKSYRFELKTKSYQY